MSNPTSQAKHTPKNESALLSLTALGTGSVIAVASAIHGGVAGLLGLLSGGAISMVGIGTIKSRRLVQEDFKPVPMMVGERFGDALVDTNVMSWGKPAVEKGLSLLGVEKIDYVTQDIALIKQWLVRSSLMLAAPTNSGKSRFLSLLLVLIMQDDPQSSFFIATPTPWKRSHSWAGLKFLPDEVRFQFITEGQTKRVAERIEEVEARGDVVLPEPSSTIATKSASQIIMAEIDAVLVAFWGLMNDRMEESTKTKGDVMFHPAYLFFDEEPAYMGWCKTRGRKFFEDRQTKFCDVLRQGDGLQMFILAVAQANAVGQSEIPEAEQVNMRHMSINPTEDVLKDKKRYPGGEEMYPQMAGVGPRAAFIGTDRQTFLVGIPHMPIEPELDWSTVHDPLAAMREWFEAIAPVVENLKSSGMSMSKIWGETITKRDDFPDGQSKRPANNNPLYVKFRDTFFAPSYQDYVGGMGTF
ncbi:MAG: hypothetical protein AAGD25_10155 [Cyanobacteria bacterium P01_F01_bin.150]